MKQVVTIRLGHYVLTADDDAAEAVKNYSQALKKKYQGEDGAEEIVADIEERMGELLTRKQKDNLRNYSTIEDVQEVIAQIGPVDAENTNSESRFTNSQEFRRRLYRDPEHKILGGVWAGMAAYFDIDVVFLRVAWVLSMFVLGFGVPLYIVLWIVVPEARTTAEKMMMRGQKPDLKNFEENVKRELNNVGARMNSPETRNGLSSFLRALVMVFTRVMIWAFRVAFGIIGFAFVFVLIAMLVSITTDSFHIHGFNIIVNGQKGLNVLLSGAGNPFWVKVVLIGFVLISIAYFSLRSIGFGYKKHYNKIALRYVGSLCGILFLFILFFVAVNAGNFVYRAENNNYKQDLQVSGDTLYISSKGVNVDADGMYSLNVLTDIRPSENGKFQIEQYNVSYGRNYLSGSSHNSQIPEQYTFANNTLNLTESRTLEDLHDKGAGWVRFIIYVPKGKFIRSSSSFGFHHNNFSELQGPNQIVKTDSNGFISGSGSFKEQMSLPAHLENLKISGHFQVQISHGKTSSLQLISGPILNNRDWINIDENTLDIDQENSHFNNEPSVIHIVVGEMENLEISGACEVVFNNWNAEKLNIEASGACNVEGQFQLNRLVVNASGVSHFNLKGKAEKAVVEMDGASQFDAEDFKVTLFKLDLSGVSKAKIWATESLKGEISGASHAKLKGNPPISNMETSGSSRLEKIP